MKNILLQDKLGKEDKIQFYHQQLFDKARPLKKAICLLVSIIFVYDFIETQFIFPEEFTASARSFTKYTTIFGLVLTFITYYISIFKFFERKDQKIFKVRYLLMLMTVIFYAGSQSLDAYYKLIDRNASQDNQKWIYTLMRSYNQIWVILLTDILIPVWYLKLVVASFYWVALLVFYYQTGYQYVSMIWSAAVSSIVFAASIWGIKAYNDWKNFVYKSNTEAWNGVHKYILDKVPDAIAIVDQKLSVIYSNSNFESLCGNDISQLSQRLSNIKEIEIKSIEYNLKQARIKSNDEYNLISREERTTSQTFMTFSNLIENVISCRRKDNTSPDGYVMFNASLAPQEATQTSVHRSYEIKVGRLHEYGKVILILNDTTQRDLAISLETANHYKDKLLATVSHDLRAPIMGGLTFIENAIQNPKVARDVKEVSLIPAQKSCKFLLHLVNDILDFSQINAKKLRMSFEKLSIIETIRNCYQLVEMQAIHKGIGFTLELGYNIPDKFTTDHNRLSQIIINLLTNAIKFTFNGEIKLSINAIEESLIEIKVSDTGIGIKEEDQPKLFQEFARINYDKTNINPRGIGLGLVIANKLAKKLGVKGKKKGIDVNSKYGEGTTFSFIIIDKDAESPIVFRSSNHEVIKSEVVEAFSIRISIPEKEEDFLYEKIDESNLLFNQSSIQCPYGPEFFKRRPEQRLTFPLSSGRTVLTSCGEKKSRGKVLIVDDDPLNVLALESIFNQHQILTDAAFSGQQAIDKITQAETMHKEWEGISIEVLKSGFNSPSSNLHHPDDYRLILMDYEMPNMNGLETCRKLIAMMKNRELRQMPIVCCSGHIGKEFVEKCQENGMTEVISKPPNREELLKLIDRYMVNCE